MITNKKTKILKCFEIFSFRWPDDDTVEICTINLIDYISCIYVKLNIYESVQGLITSLILWKNNKYITCIFLRSVSIEHFSSFYTFQSFNKLIENI